MKIGVTEQGDAGLDFSWVSKLLEANIIISKNMSNPFIRHLLEHQKKIILHIVCTGMGSSKLEPNVIPPTMMREQVQKLIDAGFPVKQMVLRTDPIIPTEKGIMTADLVWQEFANTGISRVKYSSMDMYPHVKERFKAAGIPLPYESFHAPKDMMLGLQNWINTSGWKTVYSFESCGECSDHNVGCVSKIDTDILGIKVEDDHSGFQRPLCACLGGKTELLTSRKRCKHACVYCYWKD